MNASFFVALAAFAGQAQPQPAPDLQEGHRLYEFHCAFCHGRGDDGFAANLVSPQLPRAPTDAALAQIIKGGIPGTDMPPAYGMTEDDIGKVVAWVRALGRSAPQRVPGDPQRGQTLYRTKGQCATCHMIRGEGGRTGPDLTDIGARRSPSNLRASLLDPDASLTAGFVTVRLTTRDGRSYTGVRLNEDTFSIHLRDSQGRIHSFEKSRIAKLEKDLAKSAMPGYRGVLSDSELDDLIAYLFSLRGES